MTVWFWRKNKKDEAESELSKEAVLPENGGDVTQEVTPKKKKAKQEEYQGSTLGLDGTSSEIR